MSHVDQAKRTLSSLYELLSDVHCYDALAMELGRRWWRRVIRCKGIWITRLIVDFKAGHLWEDVSANVCVDLYTGTVRFITAPMPSLGIFIHRKEAVLP